MPIALRGRVLTLGQKTKQFDCPCSCLIRCPGRAVLTNREPALQGAEAVFQNKEARTGSHDAQPETLHLGVAPDGAGLCGQYSPCRQPHLTPFPHRRCSAV